MTKDVANCRILLIWLVVSSRVPFLSSPRSQLTFIYICIYRDAQIPCHFIGHHTTQPACKQTLSLSIYGSRRLIWSHVTFILLQNFDSLFISLQIKSDHEFQQEGWYILAVLGATSFPSLGAVRLLCKGTSLLSSMSLYKDTQGLSVAVPILTCKVQLFFF